MKCSVLNEQHAAEYSKEIEVCEVCPLRDCRPLFPQQWISSLLQFDME